MRKTKRWPLLRVLGLLMLISLWSFGMKAQTANHPVLTWDQEVGCIKYDDRGERDYYNFYEQVQAGFCLRVCEGSTVNYSFSANNVAQVQWQITGGQVQSSSTTGAQIRWGNAGNGSITLNITYTDNTVEVLTLCVEKIISPKAYFEIDGIEPHQRDFCTFLPISFKNLSTANGGSDLVNYLWDFGDGTTSSTFEPTHTYDHPGHYTITLQVTNSCNCSSIYKWDVEVKRAKEFEISCPSVVCEGSSATYSVNDGCGGDWKVIGGSIVAHHGTSIEVVWDQVDPQDGFGYISYRSRCYCPSWTTVKVPVILRHGIIKGPDMICQGSQARFSLPQWPATEFDWMIDGASHHQMLVRTEQRNEIVVDGLTPGTYNLQVIYRNTLIDDGQCMGKSDFQFTVVERPEISTGDELTNCQHTPMTFYNNSGSSVYWQVQVGGSIVYSANGPSMSYNFPTAGTHVVTASNNGCQSDPITVEIVQTPVLTGTISGPNKVCLNTPYTYTLSEDEPGFVYMWSVTNGQIVGDNTGTEADVIFTSANAVVRVVKQAVKNGKICSSLPAQYNVSEIVINPVIQNNSGLTTFCPSSTANFTLNLGGITPDLIQWSIVSSTGATNFGSIIEGINSPNVKVGFNEISSSSAGLLKVAVTKCGRTIEKTYPIQLLAKPVITIGNIDPICSNQGNVVVPISITPALPSSAQIQILIDGVAQGTVNYTGGSSITIPNNFTNQSNNNIARSLTLQLSICNYTSSTSKNVTVYPQTELHISPQYSYVVCPTTYTGINITSTVSTGITASMVFKWYKTTSTTPIPGFTGPNLTISGPNPGGTYYLEVIDRNGCLVKSDYIYVTESCGGGTGTGGCTITPDPNASMAATWTDCDEITAGINVGYAPTSITWSGSIHLTLDPNTQNMPTGKFKTTVPGAHTVTVLLNYSGCIIIKTFTVKKHYQPKLATEITCNGDGTYKVTLHNNSLTYEIDPSLLHFGYSGPGVPSSASGNSYILNSVAPGTHNYTLTITSPGKPSCSIMLPVTLATEPSPNFTLSPLTYCSDDTISLTIPNYNASNKYEWVFSNTSFIASGATTYIQLPPGLNQPIKLRITTPYGCTYETTTANAPKVTIKTATFSSITINPPVANYCQGNAQPLTVSASPMPANVIWMLGNQQVGSGTSFLPPKSGSYWPVLIDQDGCKNNSMATNPKNYLLRKPPYASISGNTSVCYGETTTLTGITMDDTAEHRWSGPSIPANYGNWVSGNTNKVITVGGNLSPGTYTYTFFTRAANDTSCANSFTMTIVVHPPVPTPSISFQVENCDPYVLRLTANGPSTGTYTWSNGMSGQSIRVTHGGAYSVTYTETTGCSATGYIQAPHNPQRAMWIVPSGCYTVCQPSYLIGPLGMYEQYKWEVNNATTQSGSNAIQPQQIVTTGTYQLSIHQQGCTYESNRPMIQFDPKRCPQNPCRFKANFELSNTIPGGFEYHMFIDNPTGSPITVSLSSFYGYGTFIPDVVVLNPGSNSFPVEFHVNGTYSPGVHDFFIIGGPDCASILEVQLRDTHWRMLNQPASITLTPNPTTDQTTVVYHLGTAYEQAQSIAVYDLTGVQHHKQNLSGKDGEIPLSVKHLPRGTYVVVLEADGKRIATEKLIKK